jgi:hypothetical protein
MYFVLFLFVTCFGWNFSASAAAAAAAAGCCWGRRLLLLVVAVAAKVQSWKIRLCQEIRTPYPTHDDQNTASHPVELWRKPDFIRNLRWGGLST